MRGAALSGARLIAADLQEADLRGADITMAQFTHTNLEKAKLDGVITDGFGPEGWFIEGIKCSHFFIQHFGEGNWYKKKRIPKSGYFKPGEFEDRYKSRPTIEFVFEHGMKVLDPAILGAAIDLANSEHPSKGFRLLSIDAKGGVPKAVIEIADKVSKEDALGFVHDYYQRVMEQMHKEIEGLRIDKESLLQIAAGKTLLPVVSEPLGLTDTESNIIQALGNKTLKGSELLEKAGYNNSSHYRQILSNLVKRKIFGRNANGYYIIDPDACQ